MKLILIVFILAWSLGMKAIAGDFTEQTAAMSDASSFNQDKQTYLAVKSDALNFLAGEEATVFLETVIDDLRLQNSELHHLSDEEIVLFIIETSF